MVDLTVIGGGLAGCETAWQAAERGLRVRLFEMRPGTRTAAHQTDLLAELVCSNSLKSLALEDASGLLKAELRLLGSLLLPVAEEYRVPAGSALAVDRRRFAEAATDRVAKHPRIEVVRAEVPALPADRPLVVATGPLTSGSLAQSLEALFVGYLGGSGAPGASLGSRLLFFYDAISPIVAADSVNREIAFAASRYGKGGADYLNCPMTRDEYRVFREALLQAETYPLHPFEDARYFEGCLPIEELAARGEEALAYGPMRPVGLTDPRTGRRPHAVVQLRRENLEATMYNLVGFQTKLRQAGQRRILAMIPGLERVEILRYGSMHRNTFLTAPLLLTETLQFRGDPAVFFAGQITGVEGYLESAATGLLAGLNASRLLGGERPVPLPETTALGSLVRYITGADPRGFQPMNVHFGLLPPLGDRFRDRRQRNRHLAERALRDLEGWRSRIG